MIDHQHHCHAVGSPSESVALASAPLEVPKPYNTFGPLVDYDLSRVDLSSFPSITPKIDRLDITAFEEDLSVLGMQKLRKALGSRVTSSRNIPRAQNLFFMVNDLTGKELRFLVQHYYSRLIQRLEVAVDFKLAPGENDLRKLWLLKAQLRHCLAPQGFPRLSEARRKVFLSAGDGELAGRGRFVSDGLGTPPASTQVIWENQGQGADVVGLYVKTEDKGIPLSGQPFVRLELRLRDSGPHHAGFGRLGLIPARADSIRKVIAPAFHVTSGFNDFASIRGSGVPGDAWQKWGAAWATKHGHELTPDGEVNRRIGLALQDLRKMLMRVPPPDALHGRYEDWVSDYS
jgi:hypothetical protein